MGKGARAQQSAADRRAHLGRGHRAEPGPRPVRRPAGHHDRPQAAGADAEDLRHRELAFGHRQDRPRRSRDHGRPDPGTHKDGVSFYDPYCDLLFTGDLLFPGKINIGNDTDFVASLERLKAFAAANPVKWLLGGHIEMMFVPGKYYPRFATFKPYERVLEMTPNLIDEALEAARAVQGKDMMLIRPDFVLFNGVSPDQRTPIWPEGVPNIRAPHPF
ncbi:MBL fold metallo-hydrolase [Novosphingobium resinovorum]